MNNWRLIMEVLDSQEKRRFGAILGLMLLYSLFESIGLALIVPYVGVLADQERAVAVLASYTGWNLTAHEIIVALTAMFFSAITVKSFLQVWVNRETARFPYEFYHHKAARIFDLYLGQSYQSFIQGNTGVFIKNCTNTIEQCSNALVQYLKYLSAILVTFFLTVLILFEFPAVSVSFIVLFALVGMAMHRLIKGPQRWAGEEKEVTVPAVYQTISDSLLIFKELKLYEKRPFFLKVFDQFVSRLSKAHEVCVYYPTLPVVYIEYIAIVALLAVVVFYVLSGLPIVDLVAPLLFFGAVGRRLLPSINAVVAQRIQMQAFVPALECLETELHRRDQCEQATTPLPFVCELTFDSIRFAYREGDDVLRGVTFSIPKNSSVAFVGPSGAGKSTLVDLVISLFKPTSGSFIVDGLKVDDLACLKHLIGYVPQDVALIDGTIAENIALGESRINLQQLHRVVEMAHLTGFVDDLELGLDTKVGERGVRLSGGQKQRVGIARALYHNPEILVFDEATSALDNISEAIIAQAIREMAGQKTIIAVAHRLSTVESFDTIHVMEAGVIIAKGTHTQLLSECSLYQRLCQETPCALV